MKKFISVYDYCKLNKLDYLIDEWDYEKNTLDIKTTSCGSHDKAWWKCKNGHSFFMRIGHRTKDAYGCRICSNEKKRKPIVGINDLLSQNPLLANEWDVKLNNGLKPDMVTCYSNIKYWWKCPWCGNIFSSTVNNRTNGSGCKKCGDTNTSFQEYALYYYLKNIFDVKRRYQIRNDNTGIQFIEFDIYLPNINTAIAYDSYEFHKNKYATDNYVNNYCLENNIKIYRIRDIRLEKLNNSITIDFKRLNSLGECIIKILRDLNVSEEDINKLDINPIRDYYIITKYCRELDGEIYHLD